MSGKQQRSEAPGALIGRLLPDSLGHETRDGLAAARLVERSSGADTAGARSVAKGIVSSGTL
jgi:hypothetical protein